MNTIQLESLNKDALYILSVSNIKTNLIKNTALALLIYHLKWYVVKVGYGGLERVAIEFIDNQKLYIAEVGEITLKEKTYIFNKYYKNPLKNKWQKRLYAITSVLIGWPYPFLSAAASVELPTNLKIFGYVVNYFLDLIRDIQLFFWQSIIKIKTISFGTKAVLQTINEINILRMQLGQNLLVLSPAFYKLLAAQGNKYCEIYPQQLFNTLEQSQLIKDVDNKNTTFDI